MPDTRIADAIAPKALFADTAPLPSLPTANWNFAVVPALTPVAFVNMILASARLRISWSALKPAVPNATRASVASVPVAPSEPLSSFVIMTS